MLEGQGFTVELTKCKEKEDEETQVRRAFTVRKGDPEKTESLHPVRYFFTCFTTRLTPNMFSAFIVPS
jgi:hypothetical protein